MIPIIIFSPCKAGKLDNNSRLEVCRKMLGRHDIDYSEVDGFYEEKGKGLAWEKSFAVSAKHLDTIEEIATMFNQECILHIDRDLSSMLIGLQPDFPDTYIGKWKEVNKPASGAYTKYNGRYFQAV